MKYCQQRHAECVFTGIWRQSSSKWHHLFKPATAGQIVQVLGRIDSDAELEITSYRVWISVTMDLESTHRTAWNWGAYPLRDSLWSRSGWDCRACLFAFILTYSSSNTFIDVIAVDSLKLLCLATICRRRNRWYLRMLTKINSPNSFSIMVCLWCFELAKSVGGTSFGDHDVTAGDYNGDGVDEIAGANTWGNVTAYSAQYKTTLQLYSQ